MWTSLVAGVAAHDLNNMAQGMSSLLALALAPSASRDEVAQYAGLAREAIDELRQMATDLRIVSAAGEAGELVRLDVVARAAVSDLEGERLRENAGALALDVGSAGPDAVVRGTGAALQLAVRAVVRHCAAVSAGEARVALRVSVEGEAASIVVAAPAAAAPPWGAEEDLGVLLHRAERGLGGNAGLVLAGAAVHLCGGRAWAGPMDAQGLQFRLSFPLAAARRADPG